MSDRYFWLVYISLIVLLPMVPSMVIFKLLPSRAAVRGPFKGLKINLGGAFAAYFVVLLLVLGLFRNPPPSQSLYVWRVNGKINLGEQEEDGPLFETVRFSLVPPPDIVENDGSFSIKVLANSGNDKDFELGGLRIEASGYQPVSLNLDKHPKDLKSRTVQIEKPIKLRLKPDKPYQSGVPLQPDGAGQ